MSAKPNSVILARAERILPEATSFGEALGMVCGFAAQLDPVPVDILIMCRIADENLRRFVREH